MSKRVLNKIQGAFQSLGIELKKGRSLYRFEYEHIPMFLIMSAKDVTVTFGTEVVDPGYDCMNENILNLALDIVDSSYNDCYGDWNDGMPYFVSHSYVLKGIKEVSAEWLDDKLKSFSNAYMFLEINIHLLCDPAYYGLEQEEAVASYIMSDEEFDSMIDQYFIKDDGVICIDGSDIKMIKENSDFLDGCKKSCSVKDMKESLKAAIDEMSEIHTDMRLSHLAIKILYNNEVELKADDISKLGEALKKLEDMDIIWGVGNNDNLQDEEIILCIVGGFKNK